MEDEEDLKDIALTFLYSNLLFIKKAPTGETGGTGAKHPTRIYIYMSVYILNIYICKTLCKYNTEHFLKYISRPAVTQHLVRLKIFFLK